MRCTLEILFLHVGIHLERGRTAITKVVRIQFDEIANMLHSRRGTKTLIIELAGGWLADLPGKIIQMFLSEKFCTRFRSELRAENVTARTQNLSLV